MKLKHLFWWIAGADPEQLEKCPSDQKRMGAIGMVILTTSVVAFFAGTAAAMFFTQKDGNTQGNLGWSIAFGVLWAIIIFMIDRSLVVTMKKDPTKTNQFSTVAGPFIFRMFLAAIIALMISIPLELYIFDGFIGVKGMEFAAKEATEYSEITLETQRIHQIDSINTRTQGVIDENKTTIAQLDNDIADKNKKIKELQAKLNKPTTPRYNEALQKLQEDRRKLNSANNDLSKSSTKADSIRIEKQIGQLRKDINEDNAILREEKQNWNKPINEQIAALNALNEQSKANRNALSKDISVAKNRMIEQDSLRLIYSSSQEVNDTNYKKKQREANRFIRDYQILSRTIIEREIKEDGKKGKYLYPTELFFYWLIRLIFFLIELLPTLVKVITPVGVYDRLVYEEEKTLEAYFQSEEYHDAVLAQQKAKMEFENKKQKIESTAQLEILKHASSAQNDIAQEAIERWKQNELEKLNTTPAVEVIPESVDPETEITTKNII